MFNDLVAIHTAMGNHVTVGRLIRADQDNPMHVWVEESDGYIQSGTMIMGYNGPFLEER